MRKMEFRPSKHEAMRTWVWDRIMEGHSWWLKELSYLLKLTDFSGNNDVTRFVTMSCAVLVSSQQSGPTIRSPGARDWKTAAGIGFTRSGTYVRGEIGQFELPRTACGPISGVSQSNEGHVCKRNILGYCRRGMVPSCPSKMEGRCVFWRAAGDGRHRISRRRRWHNRAGNIHV